VVTLSRLLTISDSSEPNPIAVIGNYLYITTNFGGNPNSLGYIRKINLTDLSVTKIPSTGWSRWANWEGVHDYINNRLISVGEANDAQSIQRVDVTLLDLATDTPTLITHPNTGDCNELIGVALDYKNKRLIAGERAYGGVTTGSNWPNGGGLWVIPLDTITDPSTWQRIYEDPDKAGWYYICIFKGYVYVAFGGTKLAVVRASIDNLTSWTVVKSSQTLEPAVNASDNMVAYAYGDTDGNIKVSYSTDGINWTTVTITSIVNGKMRIGVIGKYILLTIENKNTTTNPIYLIDTTTNTVVKVGEVSNYTSSFAFDKKKKVYIGRGVWPTGPASDIYVLEFDAGRVLTLSASKTNPAPGETITLTATLKDEAGSPIQGAQIEFYVVRAITINGGFTDDLIGTATTDSNGVASIQYVIPQTASGKMWFKALFKG